VTLDLSAWLALVAATPEDDRKALAVAALDSPAQIAAWATEGPDRLASWQVACGGVIAVATVRLLAAAIRRSAKAARDVPPPPVEPDPDADYEAFAPGTEEAPIPYEMTDLGNARMLVARECQRFRWCGAMPGNGWMVWDGARWAPDDTKAITRAAMAIGSTWRGHALGMSDDALQSAMRRHADKSESAASIRAAIELASADSGIVTRREQYDADDWALNTPDATYDLKKITRHAPRQSDYITKIAGVRAAKTADCPQWLAFLDRIMGGDEYMVSFLQRVVGYCLTGSTSEQCMFIAYGRGANGKSTFMTIVQAVLGEYASQTPVETFTDRVAGGIPNDLAALAGARMVTCNESEEDSPLDEAVVKAATGGDPIPARFLNREFFTYIPKFKLWMLTNHKPIIRGTDEGIWRRLRLIPFAVTIPKAERDLKLTDKLRDELPGIMRWALDGLKTWHQLGLDPPPQVLKATDDYRKDMDALVEFLTERVAVDLSSSVLNADMYAGYSEWAKDNGQRPMSHNKLTRKLKDRGYTQTTRNDIPTRWEGVRMTMAVRTTDMFEGRRKWDQ
jgi:putative DNA primase/helicase